MTAIGLQTIEWAANNETELIEKLFEYLEDCYMQSNDPAIAYIYTDFHPTIITSENKSREK